MRLYFALRRLSVLTRGQLVEDNEMYGLSLSSCSFSSDKDGPGLYSRPDTTTNSSYHHHPPHELISCPSMVLVGLVYIQFFYIFLFCKKDIHKKLYTIFHHEIFNFDKVKLSKKFRHLLFQ